MKIKLFVVASLFCYSLQNYAQQQPNSSSINKVEKTVKDKKNGVNISFGTSGFGFGYARKLNSKFNAIVAYHTIEIKDKELDADKFLDNDNTNFKGSGKSNIIDLGAEYLPFQNSSFKLTFGVGFLNDVSINGLITYKESIQFGDVNVTPQDVGKVIIDSKWSGVAPFVGIGFGRTIPNNKVGFGIDLGTYFTKSPEVDLQADKLLAPTQEELEDLQDAFNSLTFIPRIQFKVTYKF